MDRVAVKAAEIEDARVRLLESALMDLKTAASVMRRASGTFKALELYAEGGRVSGLAGTADDIRAAVRKACK